MYIYIYLFDVYIYIYIYFDHDWQHIANDHTTSSADLTVQGARATWKSLETGGTWISMDGLLGVAGIIVSQWIIPEHSLLCLALVREASVL